MRSPSPWRIFAAAVCRIAAANRMDQWHVRVVTVMRFLGKVTFVTTEEVLDEFLAHYSSPAPMIPGAEEGKTGIIVSLRFRNGA